MSNFRRLRLAPLAVMCSVGALTASCSGGDSVSPSKKSAASQDGGQKAKGIKEVSRTSSEFQPVTSGTFPIAASNGMLKLEVSAVQVNGQLATVDMRWTPTFPPGKDEKLTVYEMLGDTGLEISLVDPVHLKRYLVVKDAKNSDLMTAYQGESVPSGGSTLTSATFASPPAGVDAVDVYVTGRPPFKNVPVRR